MNFILLFLVESGIFTYCAYFRSQGRSSK